LADAVPGFPKAGVNDETGRQSRRNPVSDLEIQGPKQAIPASGPKEPKIITPIFALSSTRGAEKA
jgi:hypothetical protein